MMIVQEGDCICTLKYNLSVASASVAVYLTTVVSDVNEFFQPLEKGGDSNWIKAMNYNVPPINLVKYIYFTPTLALDIATMSNILTRY